ncbi:helix-turn-helix domain-containing protein [Amycolatopsis sp.]|uniref:TetR/AcrR family transcriptional regulator n=1 Tax=Amycolatopsis sp. TaxID=37632 RepID=UPI002BB2D0A3|nr:helix-turn-helix domain-containing protein [Amycolatopsis sp.]HVV12844.1 helix-turn-helix domain-containing protein [Amycolatopsis sp.]
MGRPPRHTVDDLLDAAVRLFAEGGVRAVTMSAVAREAGAPSGSVYHRFPDRPALLAALWLRTVERFHAEYLAILENGTAAEAAIASTAHVVRWCRAHPGEAHVLNAGRRAFDDQAWSPEQRVAAKQTDQNLETAWRRLVRELRPMTGQGTDDLLLVLIDLPYAAVRRHLERGELPSSRTVEAVARAARTLLTAEGAIDG